MEKPTIHKEKADKFWAIDTHGAVETADLLNHLRAHNFGLGHTGELAAARLTQAQDFPRVSSERMYEMSFIETGYKLGTLAVIAFSPRNDQQPREWLVESFVGEELEPTVRTLPMGHPNIFGIDVEDMQSLNQAIEEWFPA